MIRRFRALLIIMRHCLQKSPRDPAQNEAAALPYGITLVSIRMNDPQIVYGVFISTDARNNGIYDRNHLPAYRSG